MSSSGEKISFRIQAPSVQRLQQARATGVGSESKDAVMTDCGVNVFQEPEISVVITTWSGTLLKREEPIPIVVGMPLWLKARSEPSGHELKLPLWQISTTDTVVDYPPDEGQLDSCAEVRFGFEDLLNPTVKFYWVVPGEKRISFTAIVEGEKKTTHLDFVVDAPTVHQFTIATTRVGYFADGQYLEKGEWLAAFVDWAHPGCSWSASITAPYDGHIVYIQRLLPNRTIRSALGDERKTADDWVLDDSQGVIFYDWPLPVRAGEQSKPLSLNDCPATELIPEAIETSADETFELFLLYRPKSPYMDRRSIWVPLAKATWSYKGTVRRQTPGNELTPWDPNVIGGAMKSSANGVPTSSFPRWKGRFKALPWK